VEQGCVAHRVLDFAHALRILIAGARRGLGRVVDVQKELDLLSIIGNIMRVEGFHGHATKHVSDGRHSVGQTAKRGR